MKHAHKPIDLMAFSIEQQYRHSLFPNSSMKNAIKPMNLMSFSIEKTLQASPFPNNYIQTNAIKPVDLIVFPSNSYENAINHLMAFSIKKQDRPSLFPSSSYEKCDKINGSYGLLWKNNTGPHYFLAIPMKSTANPLVLYF